MAAGREAGREGRRNKFAGGAQAEPQSGGARGGVWEPGEGSGSGEG